SPSSSRPCSRPVDPPRSGGATMEPRSEHPTKRERDAAVREARRESKVTQLADQLDGWSTQVDAMVVACIEAGALPTDPYRVKVDRLRERLIRVRAKLDLFRDPVHEPPLVASDFDAFRAGIADDVALIEAGIAELTH